ncbi:MAG: HPr family phosphocarrier protein [Desulfobacterales bacterium]|nr:HPr family phosphocarrier protein [Desulfobacterales bacterium]
MRPVTELSRNVIVINELGLHARSAARIAEIARKANSNVWIIKNKKKVDASSILDILILESTKGSKITLKIDDKSDLDILNHIVKQFESGFGELS